VNAKRRSLLLAGVGFARVELRGAPEPTTLRALKAWLGSWRGVGLIAEAMGLEGYDLALTSDEHGWRAAFLHRDHEARPWVGQVLLSLTEESPL
jgi:hypothetical protein